MSDAQAVLASVPLHRFRFGEDDVYLSQASIDAILAALAEAGLVIVPREPTEKMSQHALTVLDSCELETVEVAYRAMVRGSE